MRRDNAPVELHSNKIEFFDCNTDLPKKYELEDPQIRAVLPPGLVLAMKHFGSTAVTGMSAKPIIDILLTVASLEQERVAAVEPPEAAGYAFLADNAARPTLFRRRPTGWRAPTPVSNSHP